MTTLSSAETFVVNDLFSKLYQCMMHRSMTEKWTSKGNFIKEWFDFYASTSYTQRSLHSTIGTDYFLFHTAFDILSSLINSGHYQQTVMNRIQAMKQECPQLPIQEESAMEVEEPECMCIELREPDSTTSVSTSVPSSPSVSTSRSTSEPMSASSPTRRSQFDEELVNTLPSLDDCQYDMDHSTSIISYSTDHHLNPTEDIQEIFEFSGIVESAPLQNSDPPKHEEAQMSSALNLLRRVSRKKKPGHPKKEYFRCQHIRALKKSLRQLETSKIPGTSIHRVNKHNAFQMEKWGRMREFYFAHREELKAISDTAAGPTTDGKKKRGRDSNDPKSFNNEYCRRFFEPLVVRTYNTLFCELVYEGNEPVDMCGKMKARCCENPIHTDGCQSIWVRVYIYAKEEMLEELGLLRQEQSLPIEDFLQTA